MAKSYADILAGIKEKYKEAFVDVHFAGEIKGFTVESPSMNYVLGGKFATGRIYEIFGPESSGKTTVCTYLAAQNQRYNTERPLVLSKSALCLVIIFKLLFLSNIYFLFYFIKTEI